MFTHGDILTLFLKNCCIQVTQVGPLPWESKRDKEHKPAAGAEGGGEEVAGAGGAATEPPVKKKRFWGFKEDPYIYCQVDSRLKTREPEPEPDLHCQEGEPAVARIQEYYGLAPEISYLNFLTRCAGGREGLHLEPINYSGGNWVGVEFCLGRFKCVKVF